MVNSYKTCRDIDLFCLYFPDFFYIYLCLNLNCVNGANLFMVSCCYNDHCLLFTLDCYFFFLIFMLFVLIYSWFNTMTFYNYTHGMIERFFVGTTLVNFFFLVFSIISKPQINPSLHPFV